MRERAQSEDLLVTMSLSSFNDSRPQLLPHRGPRLSAARAAELLPSTSAERARLVQSSLIFDGFVLLGVAKPPPSDAEAVRALPSAALRRAALPQLVSSDCCMALSSLATLVSNTPTLSLAS